MRRRSVHLLLGLLVVSLVASWPAAASAKPTSGAWVRSTGLVDAPPIGAAASSARGIVAVGDGIWMSPDGDTWRRVLDPHELGGRLGGQEGELDAVTPFRGGYVAAGQAVDPTTEQAVAAVWTSDDGSAWVRARDPDLEPATPAIPADNTTPVRGSIRSITRGGPGLVAVGGVFAGTFVDGTLFGPPAEPAVWTSTDGGQWTRVDTSASFGSGAVALTLVSAVASRGAVVVAAQDGGGTTLYSSRDGRRWRPVGRVRGTVEQLAAQGDRLVAVGSELGAARRERATIWTSQDARHWRRAFRSPRAALASFTSVAASGQSFVAAGYRGRYEPLVDATVAVSRDGRTWTLVTRTGSAFASHTYFEAAAVRGKHAVVFGVETTGGTGAADDPFTGDTVVYRR